MALVRNGRLTWSRDRASGSRARHGRHPGHRLPGRLDLEARHRLGRHAPRAAGQARPRRTRRRYLTRWHLPRSPFDPAGVTIRRLLSHSAGLNSQDYSPISARPLPSLEQSLSGESGGVNARSGSDDVRITMEPGQQRNYSNGGYTLLQLAIEEVTGEPFARYMEREVLDPLGMTHSSFTFPEDLRARTRDRLRRRRTSSSALRPHREGRRRAPNDRHTTSPSSWRRA